jgi:hypothetical protein
MRVGFAPLDNIGFCLLEVNLDGEVYEYNIPSKAERVGGNKWKIRKYDVSGNPIELVIPRDMLVGFAWYNIKESLWENSTYADTIRRCKEFFSISNLDKAKTIYKTSRGFYYYVTKLGEVWNTETMAKVKGSINKDGYRQVDLGSVPNIKVHRLVAHHFVSVPKYLLAKGFTEENLVVNHLDGNKLNNSWNNLEWTTIRGNTEHASINGLLHTTIDDHLLECIWQYLQAGYSDINISKETGVPAPTVNQIRRGVSRRYRTDKYTWAKRSVDVREKERRDELAIKCVKLFNEGMSYQAIADKLGFNSMWPVFTLIGKYRDLITRKLPPKLDKATIFSIYDEFTYTDKKNCEIARQYNVSDKYISDLRLGHHHSNLACEYVNSKGLTRYWKGYRPPK